MQPLLCLPLTGLPEVTPGSDLSALLEHAFQKEPPQAGDILLVTHKVVSKAYGYVRTMQEVTPGPEAKQAAALTGKDPRQVQVIWESSDKIYACERGILMAERPDGWICANAGVDASNAGGHERLIVLPPNCDEYARTLSETLGSRFGIPLPVIICDTHGRALRNGAIGVCVGSWGLEPVRRYRGQPDRDGRILEHTEEAVSDELASAATLVMGQGAEGIPAVLIRGFPHDYAATDCAALKRPAAQCLYKLQNAAAVLQKPAVPPPAGDADQKESI